MTHQGVLAKIFAWRAAAWIAGIAPAVLLLRWLLGNLAAGIVDAVVLVCVAAPLSWPHGVEILRESDPPPVFDHLVRPRPLGALAYLLFVLTLLLPYALGDMFLTGLWRALLRRRTRRTVRAMRALDDIGADTEPLPAAPPRPERPWPPPGFESLFTSEGRDKSRAARAVRRLFGR